MADTAEQMTFIEIVPDHQAVREQLARLMQESRVLRQLLRVSERAEKVRKQHRELKRAS